MRCSVQRYAPQFPIFLVSGPQQDITLLEVYPAPFQLEHFAGSHPGMKSKQDKVYQVRRFRLLLCGRQQFGRFVLRQPSVTSRWR